MIRWVWIRALLFAAVLLTVCYAATAQVALTVSFAPPELPVYEQPPCPGDDYMWAPGYWSWDTDADDYYWVPGTWVLAPEAGFLWTPPYWAWGPGGWAFYPGYWGPQVGFYGGIVYGFGYYGHGYDGGRWQGGHFYYNRTINNVNVNVVHNVYNERVETSNVNVARVSYNGGNGGVNVRPTPQEESFSREHHVAATPAQTQHFQAARQDNQFRASVNHGKPPVAATAKPGQFSGNNVVESRSAGSYTPPANRGKNASAPAANNANTNNRPTKVVHPNDLPPLERPSAPNTGNTKLDQKYQQQQEKLYTKQNQDRQKLEQQQEKEHQKAEKQQANQQKQQQMEQKHQQQTQQMAQHHTEQRQQMQERQTPAPPPAHANAHH